MQIEINDKFEVFAVNYALRVGVNFKIRENCNYAIRTGVNFQLPENSRFITPLFSVTQDNIQLIEVAENEQEYFNNIKQILLNNFKQVTLDNDIAYVLKHVQIGDFVQIHNHHFIASAGDTLTEISTLPNQTQRRYLDSFHNNTFKPSQGYICF